MRNGQKRMRGRGGHRKSQNPLTRVYESNGPDVKIRGTANHIAEKYLQLARDAQSSGDPVGAENYFQHAEHYFRLIAVAQEAMRQQNPYYQQQQQQPQQGAMAGGDDSYDEDEDAQPIMGQNEPQPYLPPNAQPFPPRDQQVRPQPQPEEQGNSGLPAFITGSGQPQPSAGNGHDQSERAQGAQGGQERFGGGYRRRRRHRGGAGFRGERPDVAGAQGEAGGEEPQPGE
jgi:hypothetical protein